MNIISKTLLTASLLLGLLAGCAQQNPHPMDMTTAIQGAKTKTDHEALAEHYEQTASEMRQKADEHKKILKDFLEHKYLYAKLAVTGFQGHCEKLIRLYDEAADSNLEMAKLHRKMAEETN